MMKLMQLEWKKNGFWNYVRSAAIMTACLLLFLFALVGEMETDGPVELYGNSVASVAVQLFMHIGYLVFTGVMLSAFLVSDYENKNIHLMFSYPIKRQKILISKMLAVWIFNFIALVLSKLFIYAVLLLTNFYTHLTTANIPIGELSFQINLLLSSAAMVSIAYIALLVGLKMKSSRAVIVTASVLACLTQGNIGTFTLSGNIPFYIVLLVLSFVSVYLSVHKVETCDV